MTKVLIVEDEVTLADAYRFALQKAGYEVLVAYGANDGIELAKKHKPQLILLDMLMPDKNGIEFMQEIKPKNMKGTNVCILSNIENPDVVAAAKKLGAVDYLLKVDHTPYEIAEVVKTLTKKS